MTETSARPAIRLTALAWPVVNLKNSNLANPLPQGQQFTWLSRQEMGFAHEGDSPDLRVVTRFALDYPPDGPRPIELSLTMVALFRAEGPLSGEQASLFMETEAMSALWPYLQHEVATLTQKAGGPLIALQVSPPPTTRQPDVEQTNLLSELQP